MPLEFPCQLDLKMMLYHIHVSDDELVLTALDVTQSLMDYGRELLIGLRNDLALRLDIQIIPAADAEDKGQCQCKYSQVSHFQALLKFNVHTCRYASCSRVCGSRNLRIHTVILREGKEIVERDMETQCAHPHLSHSCMRKRI